MALLDLSFEAIPDTLPKDERLTVRHFAVHEGISTLFGATIVARSVREDIDLESLVGKAAGFAATGNTSIASSITKPILPSSAACSKKKASRTGSGKSKATKASSAS